MNITEFNVYRDLLNEKSGLFLAQDKAYLVETRLNPIARKWGYENISAMTNVLRAVPPQELIHDIIEAMANKETSFFRDSMPFQYLKDIVLPYFSETTSDQRHIRAWSAAASSGQEPYSIALTLNHEKQHHSKLQYSILATDISYDVLDRAKDGIYSQLEIQRGVPVDLMIKYFKADGKKWIISDTIKKLIQFEYFNLLESMEDLGYFDIVFCKNVLPYFDEQTQRSTLERIVAQMKADGFLFMEPSAQSDTVLNLLRPVPNTVGLYVKNDNPHFS